MESNVPRDPHRTPPADPAQEPARRPTSDDASAALDDARETHRRAAYAGVEPWWIDALAAAGMAVMVVGLTSRTLWGTLVGAALFTVLSLIFEARQRRRGIVRDIQSIWGTVLVLGGIIAIAFGADRLIPERPGTAAVVGVAALLFVVGFVFLRWSAHRTARRLTETQGMARSLS